MRIRLATLGAVVLVLPILGAEPTTRPVPQSLPADRTVLRPEDGYIFWHDERNLEQIEKIYAQMPPVRYAPLPDRWGRLEKTARRLKEGPRLRVVMLGDSIVNDTSRSCWNLLVQQRHPRCYVEKVTSVRGSTGCWWYKENGRVHTFVLDYAPDLVMIGGISQRDDVDSIREVIRQIRAAGSKAEILLMTGAFGEVNPKDDRAWQERPDPAGNDYRVRLRRLADETNSAFLDIGAAWGRYVRESGKDLDWFKRDPIHANERGEQILGRILDQYLTLPDSKNAPPATRPAVNEGRAGGPTS